MRALYVSQGEPDRYLTQAVTELGHPVQVEAGLEDGAAVARLGGWGAVIFDAPRPIAEDVRRLAEAAGDAWILVVAGRDDATLRIAALKAGADAWFARPYQFTEIHAKLEALARARRPAAAAVDFALLPAERSVRLGAERIRLSRREYALLAYLAERAGEVAPVGAILESVWGDEAEPRAELVRNQVSRLRALLERGRPWKLLHAVRGHGYCFRIEPA